jgi:cytochrome c
MKPKYKPLGTFFLSSIFIAALAYSCSSIKKKTTNDQVNTATVISTYGVPVGKPLQRTGDIWVWRTVLDLRSRMISIGLNDKLWVAYNTQNASFYKAWTGGIVFDGAVYTTAHGPQPMSAGNTYFAETDDNPWLITANGTPVSPEIVYKGHTVLNNKVSLKYELIFQGAHIQVEEYPEYFKAEERVGLERVFKTSHVPEGLTINLKMHLESILSDADVATDSKFTISKSDPQDFSGTTYKITEGTLLLKNNGTTNFSVNITPKPYAAAPKTAPVKVVNEKEEKMLALLTKSDCNTCHNRDVKTVGPSFRSIAQRYSNTPKITAMLVNKVIKGGSGNWGEAPMTPHQAVPEEDVTAMVNYIMDLDAQQENRDKGIMPPSPVVFRFKKKDASAPAKRQTEKQGIALNVYKLEDGFSGFPVIDANTTPQLSGSANVLHLNNFDFGFNLEDFKGNFAVNASGVLTLKETTNIVFKLVASDGSRLYIDNNLVVENTGAAGSVPQEGEVNLKAGKHAIKVEYFKRGERGQKRLSLQWRPYGSSAYTVVPPEFLSYREGDVKKTIETETGPKIPSSPGDGELLQGVHPAFTLAQARPDNFHPKVGGMDFLPDGRLVISTWDSIGGVYIIDGLKANDAKKITIKRIAAGLAEPLGLKVVDNEIYVMQKQELTKLVDLNKDEIIDTYETICNGWKVSPNFHEFAFGLVYKDGYFYGSLATGIKPGGASLQPQTPDRGKVLKIARTGGNWSLIASGLRVPNGVGTGVDNEIFISDNQGDWLPANKMVHLKEGAWYGSRSVDFEGTAGFKEKMPVVYLEVNTIANSPSQPVPLNLGPYQNQMIYGDASYGGIQRIFAEKVAGEYQGAVFKFTQGLEGAVNRLVWGPDGALYAGAIGSAGNWGEPAKLQYGLQKLTYNGSPVFEMLAIRAKYNGIEIEFTAPLKTGTGSKASDYRIKQWWIKPTANYGGPNMDEEVLKISKITLSADRKKVLLDLPGMKEKHVLYLRLNKNTVLNNMGESLWSTESWYSMNSIPAKP